jgi:putative nucleotidyltransferase with HDIG domain
MTTSVHVAEESRERRPRRMAPRELRAQLLVAGLFVIAAGLLLVYGLEGEVHVTDLVLLVLAATILGRLDFETGAGYTVPTQLIFVPMLFVLPPAIVPVAVALALALDRVPDIVAGRRHPQRLVMALGDAWFAVGPALVFVLADLDSPRLADWPLYLLALLAQFTGDFLSAAVRERLGHGLAPSELLTSALLEVWFVDLLLSAGGLLAAFATEVQPYAYLLVLPPAGLLAAFSRERRARIGSAIELNATYRGTAMLLGDVLTDDDEYTGVHSQDVVAISLQIADELKVDQVERRLVELGALMHDIGKLATPKEILHKTGPLTEEEWLIMRDHTIVGERMLSRVGGGLREVGKVVRSSHERVDGSGYPDGLVGDEIPLASRIIAVADAYDAMTTSRTYRSALPRETAIAELRAKAGTHFDTAVVVAALKMLNRLAPDPERDMWSMSADEPVSPPTRVDRAGR